MSVVPTVRRQWRRAVPAALAVTASVAIAACGSGSKSSSSSSSGSSKSSGSSTSWKTATSASAGGGMAALVKAAKAEGTLNVIALPANWANYGELLSTFHKKYGIKIVSANPDGTSQDELNAIKSLGTQSRAPDVVDVGQAYALAGASAGYFAPYKVATWNDIPAANKDPNGQWFNDYGGYMSIGCDTKVIKSCPTSYKALLNPAYKGDVALNGDPTQAAAGFAAVYAAALANGGTLSNIGPGITFFQKLAKMGNYNKTQATQATIQSGQTPIVLNWDYLNAADAAAVKGHENFTIAVPTDATYAAYYAQAINKNAPHPAAARLWEEFLYSTQGQNLWLKGLSRPVELVAMEKAGTADQKYVKLLPKAPASVKYPTNAQMSQAEKVLAEKWSSVS
ncbi:MAG TPA: ABC transporter substrate-binding protein [Solirubrobacteraceae bacterium]|nr:ABC transporter substrate-binding protein [Solirubrobacteraceae bacterium]